MKRVYFRLIALFFSVAVLLAVPVGPATTGAATARAAAVDKMEVHFIDVGQGDATLISCGGHHMLIDAGDDTKGTLLQSYLQKRGIGSLDYLVLTHPDSDHIGGAPVIITKFAIDKVFMSDYEKDNKTYEKLIQALDNKRLGYTTPAAGARYPLGTATITILGPGKAYEDPNNASIALMIQNGQDRFLFTGDAEEEAEKDILEKGMDISADVYQVGHHGSKTSTSEAFFQAVHPVYAVISCGEDNAYGHPHAQTLNTFRMAGVKVYRTDEAGTLIATSDGRGITFDVPPSETWKAGEPVGSAAGKAAGGTAKGTAGKAAAGGTAGKTAGGSAGSMAGGDTGRAAATGAVPETKAQDVVGITYVLNRNTKKFHKPSCSSVETIKDKNREDTTMAREAVINAGDAPCKRCKP